MIRGTTVTVIRPGESTRDRLGNDVPGADVLEVVGDVLVTPGPCSDMDASRPEGVVVALTLHFPKCYDSSLRGCSVRLGEPWGGTYRVIGDPQPYMDANTPTRWNRPVEVEATDG